MFDNSKIRKLPLHGGNLTAAAQEFGLAEADLIDLSTGINPSLYPHTEVSERALRMLPTPGDIENLLNAARDFYRVPDSSSIIAAPGTQAVLQNLPLLYPGREVAILSPTYSEHGHTWESAGNTVTPVPEFGALSQGDIAVLVNPNNPDGRRYQADDILQLAENVELLIIDEAFCDAAPELSLIPHLQEQNILVLRSLGKFFGLAGLRLGFVIGSDDITSALNDRLGPWAVSGPAIEIGARALADENWIREMASDLVAKARRLNDLLQASGLSIVGGTELFTLVETNQAQAIYRVLGQAGILVRRFEDQPDWLRIGLPGAESEWEKLIAALSAINNMGE
jgi:cobalamin biosynthesis protein CobC